VRGRASYPLWMIALELRGNFAGPWSLWLSRQRVEREGRSQPYIPVEQRQLTLAPDRSIELERPRPSEPIQV